MKEKYKITILRPGGNDTALVYKTNIIKNKKMRINSFILKNNPTVEQVGFINSSKTIPKLTMAGGEFCGNATRSFAYLLLNGKKGQISLKVTGTSQLLRCGVKRKGTAFAQMPIYKNLQSIKRLSNNLYQVNLQGIVHLISTEDLPPMSNEQLKSCAFKLLNKRGLTSSSPAAGVMFVEEKNEEIFIKPVVWVRDIQTLFYETACASGTTAVGLWLSIMQDLFFIQKKVIQPSGKDITVTVKRNEKQFLYAEIDGSIEVLRTEEVAI